CLPGSLGTGLPRQLKRAAMPSWVRASTMPSLANHINVLAAKLSTGQTAAGQSRERSGEDLNPPATGRRAVTVELGVRTGGERGLDRTPDVTAGRPIQWSAVPLTRSASGRPQTRDSQRQHIVSNNQPTLGCRVADVCLGEVVQAYRLADPARP